MKFKTKLNIIGIVIGVGGLIGLTLCAGWTALFVFLMIWGNNITEAVARGGHDDRL